MGSLVCIVRRILQFRSGNAYFPMCGLRLESCSGTLAKSSPRSRCWTRFVEAQQPSLRGEGRGSGGQECREGDGTRHSDSHS